MCDNFSNKIQLVQYIFLRVRILITIYMYYILFLVFLSETNRIILYLEEDIIK